MASFARVCRVATVLSRGSPIYAKRLNFSTSSSRHGETVGFIGLGNMGAHMARNLVKNGYDIVIYDVSKDAIASVTGKGVKAARSPGEVASQVQKLVTMLPASHHVQSCYGGDDGILATVAKGTLMLDSSTIDPAVSVEMKAAAAAKGATYMDAPVSGGVNAARDAALTFMVGGEEADFVTAEALLKNLGKNVVHCGAVGTGQAAKICNNMLLAISMIGTSEAMNLGMKLGLDAKMLAKILNMSSGRCWSSEVYNPVPGVLPGVPSSNGYQGGFGTALMTKDLGIAQNAATVNQAPTPLGSLAHQLYRTMCNHGYAGKDFSSAFQFLQKQQ